MSQENKLEELPDELPRRKWWLPVLVGIVAVVGLIYGGRKIYGRVEPERLARRAKVMIDNGDYRGALITLSRALQINNNSKSATREMAELMEKLNLPQAVDWHRRLTELNPGSPEEAMALTEYALREKQPEVARQALQQLVPSSQGSAAFQNASGLAAVQTGEVNAARGFFAEAVKQEPKNDVLRYNLALAQIQAKDASERKAGWDALTALSHGGRAQTFALRTLIVSLVQERKFEDALAQSDVLVKLTQAQFKDVLTHAELLRQLQRPEWTATLERAKSMAEDVPTDAAAMVNWYRLNQKPEDALQWSSKLDPAVTDAPLVQVARALCMTLLKQWDPLMRISKIGPWIGQEHHRLAFLSRAQFEKGEQIPSAASWSNAVRGCYGDRGRLMQIAGLAAEWDWKPQAREALWAAADAASPDWALSMLYQGYASEQNTTEMLHVARRMMTLHREDLAAKNNVALFSLLVHEDPREGLQIARDLVDRKPANPIFRSTYAFALLANGMPEESLAEMEMLGEKERKTPDFAPYFAFAYQANGDLAQARQFRDLIDRKKLLPEEAALVDNLEGL